MLSVNIDTSGIAQNEAQEWVNELVNVYADMEVEDVNVSGNKISFKAGFQGMDDTEPDDIKTKIEEYLTMNEAFQASNITVK
jgi:osmotically-inducible protein OsmY